MKYHRFRFLAYEFDETSKTLSLHYGYDDALKFTETFRFDFDFVNFNRPMLDIAMQHLFFLAGVSYYKAFLAPEMSVEAGQINEPLQAFLSKTYQRGLGEFFFVNKLNPSTPINFPVNKTEISSAAVENSGLLVGIGGGKDSLVSVEFLRNSALDVATWSLGHRKQLTPLIERIGHKHYWVEREWDKQLLTFKNDPEAYNGHVPISAIIAAVGTIVAILSGRRDNVVSNEQSANEPTLMYEGTPINHQYSKSEEFEVDYQTVLKSQFGDSLRYYSLLRPLSEVRIAELFADSGFEKYKDVFSSCNRAFTHASDHIFWDGTCPKCAFVFLALTPFVAREQLETLFSGKNLLQEPELEPIYRQILGIDADKPLECVGEVKESRAAMRLAQTQYPELAKYSFELPEDYDYKTIASQRMPQEIWEFIRPKLG